MATLKKPEPQEAPVVHLSRNWLIGALVLLTMPWLVVGAVYFGSDPDPNEESTAVASADPASEAKPGAWGHLSVTPIIVSPPLEYVAADWGRYDDPYRWYFPGTSADVVRSFLASTGLTAEQVNGLTSTLQEDGRIRGVSLRPNLDILRSIDPQVRARLYLQLARSPLNQDQGNSFRFFGTPAEWLSGTLISPETRQLVEPLIYRDGNILHFADAAIIRETIKEDEERQRLAKALLRQSTMLVRLSVTRDSEIPALTEYWGRGGRSTDIRPLLESVVGASAEGSIDIVHLLPSFARNRLYRYPKLTTADLNKPLLANCLWSSLNFFRMEPDDRFLDVETALTSLREDYHIVEHGYQLGDIIGFLNSQGNLFHVAVYIADDLVFTKNGTSPVSPWTIMPLERVKDYYRSHSDNPRLIYHRRNDF
jgi:hypothetical protein